MRPLRDENDTPVTIAFAIVLSIITAAFMLLLSLL